MICTSGLVAIMLGKPAMCWPFCLCLKWSCGACVPCEMVIQSFLSSFMLTTLPLKPLPVLFLHGSSLLELPVGLHKPRNTPFLSLDQRLANLVGWKLLFLPSLGFSVSVLPTHVCIFCNYQVP